MKTNKIVALFSSRKQVKLLQEDAEFSPPDHPRVDLPSLLVA